MFTGTAGSIRGERPRRAAFLTHRHQIVLVNAFIEMLVPAALLATARGPKARSVLDPSEARR
jgi:hypothetical protein